MRGTMGPFLVYIDDILVFAKDFDKTLQNIVQ
jgi:hypothetical protein